MIIKKKIVLNIIRKDDYFICKDLMTLQLIVGTKGVTGNLHIYNIQKKGNSYYVPVETIRKRIKELTERKERLEEYIDIMNQILKR